MSLGMVRGKLGAIKHRIYFRLGEGLGKHLPGFGGFDIYGRVVVDAAIEQEPFVETADAAKLAGCRTGIDAVSAQVLQKRGYILLSGCEQDAMAAFEELGEGLKVAVVGFTGKGAQALFDA